MKSFAIVFKALSDIARLRIINLLFHSGELCVCDIEVVMGFTQTKVSRHLAYLRKAGLVDDRKKGLWMLYSIAKPRNEEQQRMLDFLADLLDFILCQIGDADAGEKGFSLNFKHGGLSLNRVGPSRLLDDNERDVS